MLAAWRQAGQSMSASPSIDERWTRVCFCGQPPPQGGPADTMAAFGLPQLTGSEEGRGPLYDNTHVILEDRRSSTDDPLQGDKIIYARPPLLSVPRAVPLLAVRIADRMIVSVPGEPTVGVGDLIREAVGSATAGAGISHVVISGLANEYLSYFTTPAEYERQHYEGGSTLYGKNSSLLVVVGMLGELAGDLVGGRPAPTAYPYDPTNGIPDDAAAFDGGAASGSAVSQPQTTQRLTRASFSWTGGPRGLDRPLDAPFVTIRRLVAGHWMAVTDDLGLQLRWSIDSQNRYLAEWEVPLDQPTGTYDFLVTANHYTLASQQFAVVRNDQLTLAGTRDAAGRLVLTLSYPPVAYQADFTYRPAQSDGGQVTATVGGAGVRFTQPSGSGITVPGSADEPVSVAAGAASDPYGNSNANAGAF